MQGVKIVRAIAGVTMSIFIAHDGAAFWCGEDMVVKGVSVRMLCEMFALKVVIPPIFLILPCML